MCFDLVIPSRCSCSRIWIRSSATLDAPAPARSRFRRCANCSKCRCVVCWTHCRPYCTCDVECQVSFYLELPMIFLSIVYCSTCMRVSLAFSMCFSLVRSISTSCSCRTYQSPTNSDFIYSRTHTPPFHHPSFVPAPAPTPTPTPTPASLPRPTGDCAAHAPAAT